MELRPLVHNLEDPLNPPRAWFHPASDGTPRDTQTKAEMEAAVKQEQQAKAGVGEAEVAVGAVAAVAEEGGDGEDEPKKKKKKKKKTEDGASCRTQCNTYLRGPRSSHGVGFWKARFGDPGSSKIGS